jgi:hypothetical protein
MITFIWKLGYPFRVVAVSLGTQISVKLHFKPSYWSLLHSQSQAVHIIELNNQNKNYTLRTQLYK